MRCLITTCLVTLLVLEILGCDLEQAHQGCKIQGGTCACGFGCKSEYRYTSNRECRNALRERGINICSRLPCLNKGNCIQITQGPGFKCRCEGTGYYGDKCEKACPMGGFAVKIPYECIVI
ncbi:protein lin-12-like [Arctopsyche grandis]|uniref:protein lin-12-like n=1 Tax=Arctopsyche grandis TaxID=121162 RepID=UPI00406D97CF